MQFLSDCRARYEADAEFRRLVDAFELFIQEGRFTPSEIRQAAMHAAIRHEARSNRPIWVNPSSDTLEWMEPYRR